MSPVPVKVTSFATVSIVTPLPVMVHTAASEKSEPCKMVGLKWNGASATCLFFAGITSVESCPTGQNLCDPLCP